MAKFAEIVNGIVKQVILVGDLDILKDGVIDEVIGAEFCHNLFGGEWVQNLRGVLMKFLFLYFYFHTTINGCLAF